MNIGTKRPMRPSAAQKLALRASIHNRFDVEVIDAQTGEVKQRARGYNVICNTLWDRLFYTGSTGFGQNYFNFILFGTGSGTPAVSDTQLFSLLGAFQVQNYQSIALNFDRRNGVASGQAVATLQAEQYVGATLTEVGIGYDSTHCVTHALLEDMNGNPISIEKTDLDVIKIYATVYLHWPAGTWYGGSVSFADISGYDSPLIRLLLGRTVLVQNAMGFVLYNTNKRTGSAQNDYHNRQIRATVSRQNKTYSFTTRLAADEANLPLRSILISTYNNGEQHNAPLFWLTPGSWCTPTPISAEAVGTGDGTATGFATAFPIKHGAPVTVYVNGEPAPNVAVRSGPADATRLEQWFDMLSNIGPTALTVAGTPIYAFHTAITEAGGWTFSLASHYYTWATIHPFYEAGIGQISYRSNAYAYYTVTIQASDDCQTWATVGTITAYSTNYVTLSVPAEHQHKKYWRLYNASDSNIGGNVLFSAEGAVSDAAHNIVFAAPPAAGAVITCDYTPDCIPKDSDHVFDISMELTLGEYQEA